MKKLIVVRHAKSSWEHQVIDHERPLNSRGIKDANTVSKLLKTEKLQIDSILCSDAVRTQKTAQIFISNLNLDNTLLSLSYDLYDFEGRNLIEVIKNGSNAINTLMVFGHNHAITSFVNHYGNKFIENVPTCGVVIIDFDIDSWVNLKKGNTISTLFPKEI